MTSGGSSPTRHSGWRTGLVIALFLLLVLGRIWLSADEEILATSTPYDSLWFARAADVAYWGGDHNHMTALRPPGYPLWLWGTQAMGIPQRDAIEMAYVGAGLLLAGALLIAGVGRWWVLGAFALMMLSPAPYPVYRHLLSDALSGPLLAVFAATMVILLVKRGAWGWGLIAGGCAGLFALVRSESATFAMTIIALAGGLELLRGWWGQDPWRGTLLRAASMVAVPMVVLSGMQHAVKWVNYREFGVYAADTLRAPGHKAMMSALARIRPERPVANVVIPRESVLRAMEVSPALASLASYMDGERLERWHRASSKKPIPAGEVLTGYMQWLVRESAYAAGVYSSIADADAFYQQVANDVNAALRDGRLKSRVVVSSYLDPEYATWLPKIGAGLMAVGSYAFSSEPHRITRLTDQTQDARVRELFDRVALRDGARLQGTEGPLRQTAQRTVRRPVRAVFGWILAGLSIAAVLGTIVTLARRGRQVDGQWLCVGVLLGAIVIERVVFFAIIEASAWHGTQPRFLHPGVPILVACVFVLLSGIRLSPRTGAELPARQEVASA